MKRVKLALVSLLMVIISLFCLAGCGYNGKYVASKIKMGNTTTTITVEEGEPTSYVELKSGNEAVISIHIDMLFFEQTIESTGTWKKGEEDKTVVITTDNGEYTVIVDGGTMTLDLGVAQLILEK